MFPPWTSRQNLAWTYPCGSIVETRQLLDALTYCTGLVCGVSTDISLYHKYRNVGFEVTIKQSCLNNATSAVFYSTYTCVGVRSHGWKNSTSNIVRKHCYMYVHVHYIIHSPQQLDVPLNRIYCQVTFILTMPVKRLNKWINPISTVFLQHLQACRCSFTWLIIPEILMCSFLSYVLLNVHQSF